MGWAAGGVGGVGCRWGRWSGCFLMEVSSERVWQFEREEVMCFKGKRVLGFGMEMEGEEFGCLLYSIIVLQILMMKSYFPCRVPKM